MSASWPVLLDAAARKVAIAEFHASCLEAALAAHPGPDPGNASATPTPAVPVQAHFEGTIIAVMAAVDQVAQAANSALGLKVEKGVDRQFAALWGQVEGLEEWFNEPLGRDLRSVRTRMVHYAYVKRPGTLSWVVEDAKKPYDGPRDLLPYARNAAAYGRRLVEALPGIRRVLALRAAP